MKRYLIFVYSRYYPSGGWYDFATSLDTEAEAKAYLDGAVRDDGLALGHALDMQTMAIVYEAEGCWK